MFETLNEDSEFTLEGLLENLLVSEGPETQVPDGTMIVVNGDYSHLRIEVRNNIPPGYEGSEVQEFNEGFLSLHRAEGSGLWEVDSIESTQKFGPLLYDIALEMVVQYLDDVGVMPDREHLTPEFSNVWKYYYFNRKDVIHGNLPVRLLTDKIKKVVKKEPWLACYYSKKRALVISKLKKARKIQSEDYDFFD